jgi:hypothetical protein
LIDEFSIRLLDVPNDRELNHQRTSFCLPWFQQSGAAARRTTSFGRDGADGIWFAAPRKRGVESSENAIQLPEPIHPGGARLHARPVEALRARSFEQ